MCEFSLYRWWNFRQPTFIRAELVERKQYTEQTLKIFNRPTPPPTLFHVNGISIKKLLPILSLRTFKI